MKKTRFFLMSLLLVTVLAFTGCGNKDDNNNAVPDDNENKVEQGVEDGIDDVKDGADEIGDDIKDGVDNVDDNVDDNVEDDNDKTKNVG